MRTISLFAVLAISLSGCGMFDKPALPRRASIDSLGDAAVDDFASRIKRAEVIYLPVENLDRSAADLIRALRDDARPFTLAWQDLSVDDQAILDQLNEARASDPSLGDRLAWNVSGQSRISRRIVLQATADLPQLAIGLPKTLRLKLQTGRSLSAEEHLLLPDGYSVPAGESQQRTREFREGQITKSSRVNLMARLFAAEKIVTYMRAHPGGRTLIFLRRRDLEGTGGVPDFVMQKINVRQLILDGQVAKGERPRLITSTCCGIGLFQVVDGSPASRHDDP
ncbi:MAG: hypothetical protein ABJB22_02785 [Verrucomicrobiota bacterium]